jgi:hypothetical protein
MKNIFIDATPLSPEIIFNKDTLEFSIAGKSYPEDGIKFYKILIDYLEGMKDSNFDFFILKFDLEYANTSSAKSFVSMVHKLQDIKNASVLWMYEKDDDQILELGNDIAAIFKVPFTFKQKK